MMKKMFFIFFMATANIMSGLNDKETIEFAIIIPSYNNEKHCIDNLFSACFQNSTHPYHIYYVNDCSTDLTGAIVEEFIKKYHLEDKVTLIHNSKRLFGAENIYNTIHKYIPDNKVVVLLNGYDTFAHLYVLLVLEQYYTSSVWMTHSKFVSDPEGKIRGHDIPEEVFQINKIRAEAKMTGLKTFRSGLFKKIRKTDLMYAGEFMRVSYDEAYMLALLELSMPVNGYGSKHCLFIPEVLYQSVTKNPDFTVTKKEQEQISRFNRSRERVYKPIEHL